MDTRQDELRRDLDATLQARKELGKEYESELVDSFLTRLESRLDARLDSRVAHRVAEHLDEYEPARRHRPRRSGWSGRPGSRLAVISLALGIPLTAIASSPESGGLVGLFACWAGIVGVNFAAAFGDRRDREDRPDRSRGDWD
ncbi:hypothetical protein F7Q99_09675 [Streptomyces kaniharaensis]|uniref:Integral membrane protein n=1 Tax=Streptomyces kaniharaensis TaxID=212423 RepID=A0A6N7KQC8_9ACTN|nr:hypothetical protein [Streptomyces kaniharaensis]MQS12547.1 hypothetical protein [Streptomyces kaniharaensis]